jgi:hypothetical protein
MRPVHSDGAFAHHAAAHIDLGERRLRDVLHVVQIAQPHLKKSRASSASRWC